MLRVCLDSKTVLQSGPAPLQTTATSQRDTRLKRFFVFQENKKFDFLRDMSYVNSSSNVPRHSPAPNHPPQEKRGNMFFVQLFRFFLTEFSVPSILCTLRR